MNGRRPPKRRYGQASSGDGRLRSAKASGRDGARTGPETTAAFAKLQRGLTGDRALIGADYMEDPELAAAYRAFYFPVSKAQALRALDVAGIAPDSFLDLGAGSGAFAAAAIERGAKRVVLVDSSPHALSLARDALSGAATVDTAVADLERGLPELDGRFACAAFGHSLNELWKDDPGRVEKRADLVEAAAKFLRPDGAVLVVEPSTLASGRDALALRDELERRGFRIAAPCTRVGPCPALAAGPEQTCRDDVNWTPPPEVRALASTLGLDKDVLKMTWFAAVRNGARHGSNDEVAYRVVSEGMLNKAGRVRFLVCGPNGRFGFSAKRDDPRATQAGFFGLRRGDLIIVDDPETRENGWGFGPATVIRRPVPSNGKNAE